MGQSDKKKKQRRNEKRERVDPPDPKIIDSLGSMNAWTPEVEDAWLKELDKMTPKEIYRRFPPMKKPKNVSLRGKNHG